MEVGLREANQHFSRIVKAVRSGVEVVLTDRGKPLARIVPIRSAEDPEAVIERLEAAGVLRAAKIKRPLVDFKPRWRLRGAPITRTLREERDAD